MGSHNDPWPTVDPPEYKFNDLFQAMKRQLLKFVTTIPCQFGRHKPNWAMICTRCGRPLQSGVFYEPQTFAKRMRKTRVIEIYPEEVAKRKRFDYLKPMARKRNIERDELILKLYTEYGNKSRVARAVGLSVTAVAKALVRVKLIHSQGVDESGEGDMMSA